MGSPFSRYAFPAGVLCAGPGLPAISAGPGPPYGTAALRPPVGSRTTPRRRIFARSALIQQGTLIMDYRRVTMPRVRLTAALIFTLAAGAQAQQPRVLTANDYARAEQFLGANTFPLVTGLAGPPAWLDDGRLWYRVTTRDGGSFVLVDAARARRTEAFDHTRLASALAA